MLVFLLFFLSIQFTFAVTESDVRKQLNNVPHGPNWNVIISKAHRDRDMAAIKDGLIKVLNDSDADLQTRYNAFSEFGYFAELDADGTLSTSDKKVVDKFKKELLQNNDDSSKVALYSGLKNAGAIDTTEELITELNSLDDEVLLLTAARSLEASLRGYNNTVVDPSLDLSFMKHFHRNLAEPYYKRNGDWSGTYKRATEALKNVYKKMSITSTDASLIENFRVLNNRLETIKKAPETSEAPVKSEKQSSKTGEKKARV